LKEIFGYSAPKTFWLKKGSPTNFPTLHSLAVRFLTMFGWPCCSQSVFFSTMNIVGTSFAPDGHWTPSQLSSTHCYFLASKILGTCKK